MTHTPRLIHTGQALVDVLVDVPHLPRQGGNVMATSSPRHAGGAANILVAAARSGGQAVHAGAIGTGPNGDLISTTLAKEGVAMSAARVPDADTGVCLVLLDPSAERTFITTTGAERAVSVDSFGTSSPRPGDVVCVTGYSLALPATRDPLLAWLDTLPAGVDVVLDPGAVFTELGESVRTHMIDHTTVWTGNAEESAALGRVGDMVGSLHACAERLRPGTVVITRDGPAGCAVLADGSAREIPGFPQQAVDTNGAGDVHTGAMIAARLAGRNWHEAARWGNAAAAIKVTRRGPISAPNAAEIQRLLDSWSQRCTEQDTVVRS